MSMRSEFPRSVERLMDSDSRIVVLLGDIGVHGFRAVFERFPDRAFNMGIAEQAMVGAAAGMAKEGMVPIVHTIAPFLVERALEQIKVDFGYQGLPGLFVTVGASHDYSSMGCSHHCPGDVEIMKAIPGMRVCVPGAPIELDWMLQAVPISPTYIRLSEAENAPLHAIDGSKGALVRTGKLATVVAIGPMLKPALDAAAELDVAVAYYTTVAPFDANLVASLDSSRKILLAEPYYEGGLSRELVAMGHWMKIITAGVPRKFQACYGTREEHDTACGLDAESIRRALLALIDE